MEQEKNTLQQIKEEINKLNKENNVSNFVFRQANTLYLNGQCQLLSQSKDFFEFSVDDEFDDFDVKISINGELKYGCDCKAENLCHHKIASLFQLKEELSRLTSEPEPVGKAYTKEGMIKRVMDERIEKATKANHKIAFANNKFGEHVLTNEKGIKYKITFRNINEENGYCSCPDYQTNKLGTCKHLMYAFHYYKNNKNRANLQQQDYPFVEVFLDPVRDYQITWFYPHKLDEPIQLLINKYFGSQKHIAETDTTQLLGFIQEAEEIKKIKIRPEVVEKIERAYNKKLLQRIEKQTDFKDLLKNHFNKATLFDYQEKGVKFATFKDAAVIADEMGLGKTIQAIATAIMKKQLFDMKKTLVVCPASLKDQWKREIEKFSHESATVIEGNSEQRQQQYEETQEYFIIANYESVLRDAEIINKKEIDFLILDEAQKIKNYDTQTYRAIISLRKKHSLVITGTPIENKLLDLYSIINIIDNRFLTPLWEFSYQYCYFDPKAKNKITGYHHLHELKTRLSEILIRREKKDVLNDLPNVSQIDIPIDLHPAQRDFHTNFSHTLARILSKKFITAFDMQRIMNTLTQMRMVCDSTYLIDLETNHSPKLEELEYILVEKMDVCNQNKKVIIFSEWKKMNLIIGKMLRDNNIHFVELNGSVPVKKRGALIQEFEQNPDCKVFISTEAGSTGLNLQVADTVINFELPWNPAKKNQRIGRIDRIGQLKNKLTVLNFISKDSIESKIARGLVLKQNLFESVLNQDNNNEIIDFSSQGRSQFLNQISNMVEETSQVTEMTDIEEKPEIEVTVDENEKDSIKTTKQPRTENEQPNTKAQKTDANNKPEPAKQKPENKEKKPQEITGDEPKQEVVSNPQAEQLEQVMNQGLGFISGLFKMATGQDLVTKNQGITVDKETGEVTMKFQLPLKK